MSKISNPKSNVLNTNKQYVINELYSLGWLTNKKPSNKVLITVIKQIYPVIIYPSSNKTNVKHFVDSVISGKFTIKQNPVKLEDIKPSKPKKKYKRGVTGKAFLWSPDWRRLRYKALKLSNGRCQLCGSSPKDGIILNVDHIKPRRKHPELALDIDNLQVLCNVCNHGKGNIDDTDWR